MSTTRVFAISLSLALLINALVTFGAAVAAIDTSRAEPGPADLIVSGSNALSPADFAAVAQQLGGDTSLGPVVSGTEPVSSTTGRLQALVRGVPSNYMQIASWETDQGRFLMGQDEASLAPVAVIEGSLAQRLFPNGDALGSTLRVGEVPFTIVGLGSDSQQQNNVVLVPFRTAQIRLFGRGALNGIVLRVSSGTDTSSVSHQTETLLRTRHNLRTGQADDFIITTTPVLARSETGVTGARVLQVIQQFVCLAKNTCVRDG